MKTFEAIYKENYKSVLRFLKTKVKDELLCEEMANDIFLRIHKNLNSFDQNKSSLKTWIFHITKNILIDHFRKRSLAVYSLDETVGHLSGDEDNDSASVGSFFKSDELNPEDLMIMEEGKSVIDAVISRLPDTHKEIANLHFFVGLSYEEIAESLNIPLGTMKARMFQVRNLLRESGFNLTTKNKFAIA